MRARHPACLRTAPLVLVHHTRHELSASLAWGGVLSAVKGLHDILIIVPMFRTLASAVPRPSFRASYALAGDELPLDIGVITYIGIRYSI